MTLQTTWFFLWGLLWVIFFITDGFDFGVGILYPFVGKSNSDKRMMIRAIGPLWNGNEVWLVGVIGVTFAAFPVFYSIMFSSLYSPVMILLFALIIRGVSFEFRNKVGSKTWRSVWDNAIFMSSFTIALLFGIIFTSIFEGLPIDGNGIYCGNIKTLISPYNILGSICFICLFVMHGSLWLAYRVNGDLKIRSELIAVKIWPIILVFVSLFFVTTALYTDLYSNYVEYPILLLVIIEVFGAILCMRYFLKKGEYFKSWISSAMLISGFVFFSVIGTFPVLLKSSINKIHNITIHNASSSPLTLKIMLITVIIFIPIILWYQIWAYRLFSGRINEEETY